jgi:hypothetical protein
MPNDQHSHPPRHRHKHWWRSWLSRLPRKLISRKFNLYQVLLAVIVSYLAFRLISLLFLNGTGTPPE